MDTAVPVDGEDGLECFVDDAKGICIDHRCVRVKTAIYSI